MILRVYRGDEELVVTNCFKDIDGEMIIEVVSRE